VSFLTYLYFFSFFISFYCSSRFFQCILLFPSKHDLANILWSYNHTTVNILSLISISILFWNLCAFCLTLSLQDQKLTLQEFINCLFIFHIFSEIHFELFFDWPHINSPRHKLNAIQIKCCSFSRRVLLVFFWLKCQDLWLMAIYFYWSFICIIKIGNIKFFQGKLSCFVFKIVFDDVEIDKITNLNPKFCLRVWDSIP